MGDIDSGALRDAVRLCYVRVSIRTLRLVVICKRWHHQRAKFVSSREHTSVPDDVQLRRRHASSEPTE
jgi:hypothetical protein